MDEPIQLIQAGFRGSALQRSDTHSGHVTFISGPCGLLYVALLLETRRSITAPPPAFTSRLSAPFLLICFLFSGSFLEENLMNQILEERRGGGRRRAAEGWGAAFLKANTGEV